MQGKALLSSALLASAYASPVSERLTKPISTPNPEDGGLYGPYLVPNGDYVMPVYGPYQIPEKITPEELMATLRKRSRKPFLPQQIPILFADLGGDLAEKSENTHREICVTYPEPSEACPKMSFFPNLADPCSVEITDCPPEALEARTYQGGGGSPFDPEPTFSIQTITPIKLELKDETALHLITREPGEISDAVQKAMPPSVREALLIDPNAAQSLASEFSDNKKSVPQWYAKMPSSVQDYYATTTPPPQMKVHQPENSKDAKNLEDVDEVIDDWISSIKVYKSQIRALSEDASSQSLGAAKLAESANLHSQEASRLKDQALATQACLESITAASWFAEASSESLAAYSASRAVYGIEDELGADAGAWSLRTRKAVLISAIMAPLACFAMAALL